MTPVETGFYLVIGQEFTKYHSGMRAFGKPSVRVTKTAPTLASQEVAVWVSLELPASLFLRPSLRAAIKVNDAQSPEVITPDVMSNIAEVVQERLGIVMSVRAEEQST